MKTAVKTGITGQEASIYPNFPCKKAILYMGIYSKLLDISLIHSLGCEYIIEFNKERQRFTIKLF
ncbi:MAG: hypothetical protein V7655_08420 [Aequorivita antarctica]